VPIRLHERRQSDDRRIGVSGFNRAQPPPTGFAGQPRGVSESGPARRDEKLIGLAALRGNEAAKGEQKKYGNTCKGKNDVDDHDVSSSKVCGTRRSADSLSLRAAQGEHIRPRDEPLSAPGWRAVRCSTWQGQGMNQSVEGVQ
jgi:hypothetical protein